MGHLVEGGAYFKVRVIIPMDFKTLTFSFQITTNNHHYMSSLKFIPELLVVFIFHSFYTCTICILTYGYIMVRFLISGAGFIRRHFLIRESMMQCLLEGASTSLFFVCLSVSLVEQVFIFTFATASIECIIDIYSCHHWVFHLSPKNYPE